MRIATFVAVSAVALSAFAGALFAQSGAHSSRGANSWRPPPGAKLWSDPQTWSTGAPPTNGECATIAAGDTVYLDVSTAKLGGLDIQGRLVFTCRDLALTADWIRVTGALEIGSKAFAFPSRASITLTDTYNCDATKTHRTLSVEGSGVLSLHGEVESPSWTHLAQTASAGATQIVLDTAPSWRVGDSIAIASTDFDAHQAEVLTIAGVADRVVTLAQPLAYLHWGAVEALSVDGVGVDERAEVALLSRRITIQGSPALDAQGRTLSGSVIVHAPAATAPQVAVEWTEFKDLGDEGLLGRYPISFQSAGDLAGSYVSSSSLHHTFNRAIALRATANVALLDNVDFDTIGHAFYMDYAAVQGTSWIGNLAFATHAAKPGFEVQPSDATPASFWITQPGNSIVGNVAAGSDAFGFFSDIADGETIPWLAFDANVAHSNGDSGFWQDKRPAPSSTSIYSNFTAYKNRRYGMWMRSYAASEIVGLRAADNRAGLYPASEGIQNDFTELTGISNLWVHDSLFVGESSNVGTPASAIELAAGRSLAQLAPNSAASKLPTWDTLCGVEIYDGTLYFEHLTFANYVDSTIASAVRKAAGFHQAQHNSPWAIDPRNHASNLMFVNARPLWFRTPQGIWATNPTVGDNGIANSMLVDDDGSLTGIAHSVVTADESLLVPASQRTFDPSWNAWITSGAPQKPYAQLEWMNWTPQVSGTPGPMSLAVSSVSRGAQLELVQPIYGSAQTRTDRFTTNVLTDETYAYDYDLNTPSSMWSKVFTLTLQFSEPKRFVIVSVPMPPINGGWAQLDGNYLPPSASLTSLQSSSSSSFFYDAATARVWVKLFTTQAGPGTSMFDGGRSTLAVISY